MHTFSYVGVDSVGKNVTGKLVAADEAGLEGRLRAMGLWLVEARIEKPAASLAKARAKAEELHLDFPVLVCTDDDMNRIRKVLGVELGGFPQTLTYDRTGKLVAQHEGIADAGEFSALASDAER